MSQAPEECALPERMKEGRSGVRCRRPPGRVRKPGWGVRLMLQRSERRWGQRESSGVSDWAGCVCVWGGVGSPVCAGLEAASLAAGRAAGAPRGSGWAASPARRLRREPEPEWSQSSDIRAPANTCERPPGPAGGRGSAGSGPGAGPIWGRDPEPRPPSLWATWAETQPCPGAAEPLLAWRRPSG